MKTLRRWLDRLAERLDVRLDLDWRDEGDDEDEVRA